MRSQYGKRQYDTRKPCADTHERLIQYNGTNKIPPPPTRHASMYDTASLNATYNMSSQRLPFATPSLLTHTMKPSSRKTSAYLGKNTKIKLLMQNLVGGLKAQSVSFCMTIPQPQTRPLSTSYMLLNNTLTPVPIAAMTTHRKEMYR